MIIDVHVHPVLFGPICTDSDRVNFRKKAFGLYKSSPVPMEQVMAVLEANFSSSEFGPNELSEKMGMSRNVLNKKLNAEIGFTSSQFIRNYRLDFARKLLAENFADRNITEIAYKSGFNDPKYFTRCFTKQYGTSPSNYRAEG